MIGAAPIAPLSSFSLGGEGKSTTSANLDIALSDAETRVLLVDANLRRPKIAEYMNVEGVVGFTNVCQRSGCDGILPPTAPAPPGCTCLATLTVFGQYPPFIPPPM
ncbi:tyrosine-protein kinase family protein [Cryobacterium levicorallinum]|uniref:Tyrosine-protein kinase family protein n=1 Tax=Cryobacterium levicorallinum TaxID=995038 RepID=A0A4V3IB01_9MICO|nr:tyrosine-protein kinase family protein [Cryobacterium levicorallinum]